MLGCSTPSADGTPEADPPAILHHQSGSSHIGHLFVAGRAQWFSCQRCVANNFFCCFYNRILDLRGGSLSFRRTQIKNSTKRETHLTGEARNSPAITWPVAPASKGAAPISPRPPPPPCWVASSTIRDSFSPQAVGVALCLNRIDKCIVMTKFYLFVLEL